MSDRKYNQKYLKSRNQGLILKLLKNDGPMSRASISKKIGIVRSTVSEICNDMVANNIILEGKKVEGNLGKRPTLLYFNKDYYCFISIIITIEEANIVVCNLLGDILQEETISYLGEEINAKKMIESVFKKTDKIISKIGIEKICLISLGSPETFDIRTGKIKWAPYISDWVGMDLRELFYERYKVDVILKDHVKLETIGEQWKSFSNFSNIIYMVITYGIGSGLIIDGQIREGKSGYLGEIAFLPVAEKFDYNELLSGNKNLGYFESKCDIRKITEIVKEYINTNNLKYNIDSFSDIASLYNSRTEIKDLINENIIKTLALGIASLIITLDPELVVINGEIVELGEEFLSLLKEEVEKIIPYKSDVVFSSLRNRSKVYGAIKNGLDYIDFIIFREPQSFYSFKLEHN